MSGTCVVLAVLVLLVGAVPFVKGRLKDPLNVLYPVVGYMCLGVAVRGIALQSGWVPDRFSVATTTNRPTAPYLLTLLGLCSLYVGYYPARRASRRHRPGLGRWQGTRLPGGTWAAYSAACAAVGLMAWYVFYERFHFALPYGPSRVGMEASRSGVYYLTMLAHFPTVGAALSILVQDAVLRWSALCLNLVAVTLWIVILGAKALAVELMVLLAATAHYNLRSVSRRQLLIGGALAFALLSTLFQYRAYGFDTSRWWQPTRYDGSVLAAFFAPLVERSYHWDAIAAIVDAIADGRSTLSWGATLKDILIFWIPRRLWPEKPVGFGYVLGPEFLDPSGRLGAYTPSLLGDLFLNFHVLGVAIGMYCYGRVLRAAYERLARQGDAVLSVMYGVILVRATHMIEEGVATHLEFTLSTLLPLVPPLLARRLWARRSFRLSSVRRASGVVSAATPMRGSEGRLVGPVSKELRAR